MNTSKESIIKIAESVCDSINFKELPIDASLTEAGFDSMDRRTLDQSQHPWPQRERSSSRTLRILGARDRQRRSHGRSDSDDTGRLFIDVTNCARDFEKNVGG